MQVLAMVGICICLSALTHVHDLEHIEPTHCEICQSIESTLATTGFHPTITLNLLSTTVTQRHCQITQIFTHPTSNKSPPT